MTAITTLLKILNKPALLNWSNKIGLEGLSINEYMNKKAVKGTNKHKDVENYLTEGVIFPEQAKLDLCLSGYEVIGVEVGVDNGYIRGRVDLILYRNDKTIIVDFKSNGKVYIDQKIQLSTYKEIYGADEIAIISFKDWQLKYINIDTKKYFDIAKRLFQIHKLIINLGERL